MLWSPLRGKMALIPETKLTVVCNVMSRLPYFIEQVYNLKRLYSALAYRPRGELEALLAMKQNKREESCQTLLTLSVQPQGCSPVRIYGMRRR